LAFFAPAHYLLPGPKLWFVSPAAAAMWNCTSTSDRQAKAHSNAIDKEIENDSKKFRKECKILLLGMFLSSIAA
jgi:hypothetical protein